MIHLDEALWPSWTSNIVVHSIRTISANSGAEVAFVFKQWHMPQRMESSFKYWICEMDGFIVSCPYMCTHHLCCKCESDRILDLNKKTLNQDIQNQSEEPKIEGGSRRACFKIFDEKGRFPKMMKEEARKKNLANRLAPSRKVLLSFLASHILVTGSTQQMNKENGNPSFTL